jgi:hypothetical protein
MSGVLARNLEKRGFRVQQVEWDTCCAPPPAGMPAHPDLVIVDLDCDVAGRWSTVAGLDTYFPSTPIVILDYERPDAARLEAWRPYGFLRKPVGVDDVLGLLNELTRPGQPC